MLDHFHTNFRRRTRPRRLGAAHRLVAGCLALSLILAAGIWLTRRGEPPTPQIAVKPAARETVTPRLAPVPLQVADNIFMLGDLLPAAAYVIQTSEGLVLVDSGLETEYDLLARGMSQFGLRLNQLKMILLTHAHGDHSMGAERLRRETGARVFIGQADAGPLQAGGPWEAIYSKFEMDANVTAHATAVDGELVDGQVLTLGEARFSCVATPGHTPGSFCFLLEDGATRALFTGDTVMCLSDGLGTLGTYAVTLPPRYRGDLDSYLESLRKLSRLPAPDLVLPGHPRHDQVPQSPRLTKERWETLLNRGIDELERWRSRYAGDGADFLDGTPLKLADGLFYLGDFAGRACYAFCAPSWSLLFDAPGGEQAADLVAEAWRFLGVSPPPLRAVMLTSCEAANTSGLASLVARTGCAVVVSPRGAERIAQLCPAGTVVYSAQDINPSEWEGIEAVPLRGRDETAAGYKFTSGEALVLVSGQMPIEAGIGELSRLRQAAREGLSDVGAFQASLRALAQVKPNVWLSSVPLHGRNANLYDDDWRMLLNLNSEFLRRARQVQKNP